MNAFSQNEFKGTYDAAVYFQDHATGLKQLRSLADHGNSEAREFLGVMYSKGKVEGLGLSDGQVSMVSTPIQFSLFARLARWFWAYTESSYVAWSAAGPDPTSRGRGRPDRRPGYVEPAGECIHRNGGGGAAEMNVGRGHGFEGRWWLCGRSGARKISLGAPGCGSAR